MNILKKLKRDFIFTRGALRSLAAIKHIHPELAHTVADDIEVWVKKTPDAIAILCDDEEWTYADIDARANQYARWAQSIGIERGDCVALMMENRAEFIIAWFGLIKIGAAVPLINTNLRSQALAHCLSVVDMRHIVLGAECLDAYESARSHLANRMTEWVTGGPPHVDGQHLDAALAQQVNTPLPDDTRAGMLAKETCFYVYTSGTTGLPKAARLSHVRIMNVMNGFAAATNATAQDRMYIALPLYHSAGGACAVGTALMVGGSMIIARRFSARHFWSDCVKYKATMFQYIGEFCRYLNNAEPCEDEKHHSIRMAVGNGLRPDIWEQFQARFRLPHILEFYAATEGNVALFNYDEKPGSIGRVPGFLKSRYRYKVVEFDLDAEEPVRDANGFCIAAEIGTAGELLGEIVDTESRYRFDGYSTKEETEKKILRNVETQGDAWFRTGDLVRQDDEGYYYFVDRIGDTFRWKGENVATSEVAEVIGVFAGVMEANVYGVSVPHCDGRAGMASLVVGDDFDLTDFYAYVSAELPNYAAPLFLRLQAELESTSTFKPRKVDLVKDGIDPNVITDDLYVAHPHEDMYVRLDVTIHEAIEANAFRF